MNSPAMLVLYVALGSAAGGVSRYVAALAVQTRTGTTFPLGTLLINVTGSLLLGFIVHYAFGTGSLSPELRALLTTGFCGGYTTFSTFSYDAARMLEEGSWLRAALYIASSVLLSIAATFAGFALAQRVLELRRG